MPERKKPGDMWRMLHGLARHLTRRNHAGTVQPTPFRPNPFTPATPLPGVVGDGKPNIPKLALDHAKAWQGAMDQEEGGWMGQYAGRYFASAYAEGQEWLGYAVLAILAQRPEYRTITETFATEMTREWIEIKSKSEDHDKQDKIDELVGRLKDLRLKQVIKEAIANDGYQGRGQIYIDTGDEDNPEELKTPIGGGGKDTQAKFGRDGLAHDFAPRERPVRIKRLAAIEPMWCYPAQYNADNPLKPDWYLPDIWWVMGKEVHRTRLLTFVSNPVPDMLKPAYSFGGMSRTQMSKPYVDFYLRNRTSASDLLNNFSIPVLSTDLSVSTMEEGSELFQRVMTFNVLRDNQSTMVINKDSEEFNIAAAPLGGVKDLVAQSAEHICVTGDTLVETKRGSVRICDITLSDQVSTRNGLAPLAWVGQTGYATELIETETSDGSLLRTTACHPVFLPTISEFVPAQNVQAGDYLLTCDRTLASRASRSYSAAIGGDVPLIGITHVLASRLVQLSEPVPVYNLSVADGC